MENASTDIVIILSGNIRQLRKKALFTQEKLAEAVGISLRHMSDIERGVSFPSPEKLEQIASVLGIPSYVLFLPDETMKAELIFNHEYKSILDKEINEALERARLSISKSSGKQ